MVNIYNFLYRVNSYTLIGFFYGVLFYLISLLAELPRVVERINFFDYLDLFALVISCFFVFYLVF